MSPPKGDFGRKVRALQKPRKLTPKERKARTTFYEDTEHNATPLDSYSPRGSFGPAGGGTWRELP